MKPHYFPILLIFISSIPCLAQNPLLTATVETVQVEAVAGINSSDLDFCPVLYDGGLVFVSSRATGLDLAKQRDGQSGGLCTSLFFSQAQGEGEWSGPIPFSKSLATQFHDGPACFSADGRSIFFTSNDPASKLAEPLIRPNGKHTELPLKIFTSERMGGDWTAAKMLDLGKSDGSDVHPCLSPDGQLLYFASDRSGGFGGMDLYQCKWQGGQWGSPVNLGPLVNTAGHEVFPFIQPDGTLYFASDGRVGQGGLDIYKCNLMDGMTWGWVTNLGEPINSEQDDFGLVVLPEGGKGYFCSDRDGGMGKDDIYQFKSIGGNANSMTEQPELPQMAPTKKSCIQINGQVSERGSQAGIAGADLVLVSLCNGNQMVGQSDQEGRFSFCVECDCDFVVRVSKSGFYQNDGMFTTHGLDCFTGDLAAPVDLDLTMIPDLGGNALELFGANATGSDILEGGIMIEIGDILYEFDQYRLQPAAMAELDKVVEVVSRHADLSIEIRAHTDSRGDDDYNLHLSSNRAKEVQSYFILKGIDPGRVSAKGFGEEQPLNGCRDGVPCSENEHRMNRRTEIKVFRR